MASSEHKLERWLTGREAARQLGIGPKGLIGFAERRGIRRRVLDGARTTYHAGDVAAVAAQVQVVGAGVQPHGGES